jgi:hypothetical protein
MQVNRMQSGVNWSEKRKGLMAKREYLFKQYQANPTNIRAGQEIKEIDDQVAECEEHIQLLHLAAAKLKK